MKKFFTLLMMILWVSFAAYGQIVITEISYNPPEGGTDSLEYIELFNRGSAAVNLKDYKFTRGVEFTFPEVTLNAGAFLLLSVNEGALTRNYNKPSLQWTAGALNNGGEVIAIADPSGTEVYSVDYKDVAPWPTNAEGTDGEGRSIEICDPAADPNDGSNWKASQNDLGFAINGKQVFGTPGATNSITTCVVVPDVTVEVSSNVFTPKDITIDINQTVRWVNKGGFHNVNGTKLTFPNNPEGFGNGAASSTNWTYDFKFTKEGKYDYTCDVHSGMTGTVTVKGPVVTDMFPSRSISSVTTVNADGVTDSLSVNCTLKGIVYGVNLRPAGLQFTIIDNQNNGIGAFSNSSNFNYTVKEGDEVEIKGAISQFNGFTQMTLADVKLISQNNTLVLPKDVTSFNEEDESSLVQIGYLSFVDPSQWTGAGSGFNMTMKNSSGQEFTIRIDNDIDAYSAPIPSQGTFFVTGLLGQFDNSLPYTEGYQLLPRYLVDFDPAGSTENSMDVNMKAIPNPTTNILSIITDSQPERLELYNTQGQILGQYFNATTIDMSEHIKGIYFIKAVKGDKSSALKVIKM